MRTPKFPTGPRPATPPGSPTKPKEKEDTMPDKTQIDANPLRESILAAIGDALFTDTVIAALREVVKHAYLEGQASGYVEGYEAGLMLTDLDDDDDDECGPDCVYCY